MYLGCHHDIQRVCHTAGTVVKVMQYNMEEFLQSCVDRYQEPAGGTRRMVSVRTPFLTEDPQTGPAGQLCGSGPSAECPLV